MAPEKKANELKRKNVVCLKLTDLELTLLDQSAEEARLTRSEYLRGLILNRKMTARYQIVIDSDEVKDLLAEYGKIGSNLNQIARYFNTGGQRSLAMQEEIRSCLAELYSLRKRVLRLAGDF